MEELKRIVVGGFLIIFLLFVFHLGNIASRVDKIPSAYMSRHIINTYTNQMWYEYQCFLCVKNCI